MAEIQLRDGKVVLVDDEDFLKVSSFDWFWHPNRCPAASEKSRTILMPRLLMDAPVGSICSYKSEDRFDNRKVNIVVRPRKRPTEQVTCACGCGTKFDNWRRNGRRPRFVNGHNPRKSWNPNARRETQKRWAKANPQSVVRFKRQHYRRRKLKAMAFLGNSCVGCGISYNGKNAPIFEFDHLNPKEKSNGITRIMNSCSWEKVVEELKKCQLLCANCHNQKHGGNW